MCKSVSSTKSPAGEKSGWRSRVGPPKRREKWERWAFGEGLWLGFSLLSLFSWTLTLHLAEMAGVFCNKNTGTVAALKHHRHPLKYLANSYFGQDGGEACFQPPGIILSKIPGPMGKGLAFSHLNPVAWGKPNVFSISLLFLHLETTDKASSKVVLDQTCRSEHIKVWSGAWWVSVPDGASACPLRRPGSALAPSFLAASVSQPRSANSLHWASLSLNS